MSESLCGPATLELPTNTGSPCRGSCAGPRFLTTGGRVAGPSLTPIYLAGLHRRAFQLEWLTTLWNVAEAVIAIGSGAVAGSSALVAFGIDSMIEVSSALVVLGRLLKA